VCGVLGLVQDLRDDYVGVGVAAELHVSNELRVLRFQLKAVKLEKVRYHLDGVKQLVYCFVSHACQNAALEKLLAVCELADLDESLRLALDYLDGVGFEA